MLSIYKIVHNSKIYGPGSRDVIWFTGCSLRCKNCINPELWDNNLANFFSINEVISQIESKDVTLLGGEPLQQVDISLFVDSLKENQIGIILFTGYEVDEIPSNLLDVVNKCDVVIYGRYKDELKDDSLYLRGSSNQSIVFNTDRYSKEEFNKNNSYEVLIDNEIELHGRTKTLVEDLLKIK